MYRGEQLNIFPLKGGLPHKVGIISLVILAVVIPARYAFHLAGAWASIYVVGTAVAFYLNVFVGVVQAFLKIPALKALAPTQKEPPFLVAQLDRDASYCPRSLLQRRPVLVVNLRTVLGRATDGVTVTPTYRKPFDLIFQRAKNEEWSGR